MRRLPGWGRFTSAERLVCQQANRACRVVPLRWLFAAVSRLGDGVFWYTLMLALPLAQGRAGGVATLRMAAFAIAAVVVYKLIKWGTARPRPCAGELGIESAARVLDQYSFPSGHTLHAVGFTLVAVAHFPALEVILVPFTGLVACSRVVLGLHYPTDVAVGALLGYGLGLAALAMPLPVGV